MNIADVKTYQIHPPIPDDRRVESGAGLKFTRQMCLIEIRTDDGLAGYGSPSGPYDLPSLERTIQSVLAPHLIGQDARNTEYLRHRLYHGEIAPNIGSRGIGIAVLSGIDLALWVANEKNLERLLRGRKPLTARIPGFVMGLSRLAYLRLQSCRAATRPNWVCSGR